MRNITSGVAIGIGLVLVATGLQLFGYWEGYSKAYAKAYRKGISEGYGMALDTVSKILDTQVKSDTTITKLTIANKDTITVFLSRNTPLNK